MSTFTLADIIIFVGAPNLRKISQFHLVICNIKFGGVINPKLYFNIISIIDNAVFIKFLQILNEFSHN